VTPDRPDVTGPGLNGPTPNGTVIRCLIADDQAMVREGFAAMLAAEPGIIIAGQAIDGADAVRQAHRLNPDVVLMDVRMPVMDGLQAARHILSVSTGPRTPRVLMLTTFDLDEYVYEALRAGASGFLLKDATTAELIHAVKVVAAGDALLAPSVTRRLIADFTRNPPAVTPSPATLDVLTSRETEVLTLIAQGMSNTEISDALAIAAETTKSHVKRILAKLGLRDRAQAVVIAYESGLVTPGGLPLGGEVVEHLAGNRRELVDLLGGEHIDQVPADRLHVQRRRVLEYLPAERGQEHGGAAPVVATGAPAHQAAAFHPAHVMGQAAGGPQQAVGQGGRPPGRRSGRNRTGRRGAGRRGGLPLCQRREHVVVRIRQVRVAAQITSDLQVEERPHPAVPPPGALLIGG
jgi:DNA-binding NarL/FixJ family response regulator